MTPAMDPCPETHSGLAARLDLTGLFCPEVVLRVREACRPLPEGKRLEIVSTDPLSAIDIPLFALKAGHTLAARKEKAGEYRFELILGAPAPGRPE